MAFIATSSTTSGSASPAARSHFADGSTRYPEYGVGEYCELRFEAGDSLMHDLENIGDEDLVFTTVEYFASPNQPLSLD